MRSSFFPTIYPFRQPLSSRTEQQHFFAVSQQRAKSNGSSFFSPALQRTATPDDDKMTQEKPEVQRMSAPQEDEMLQGKAENSAGLASAHVSNQIESSRGKGQPLPEHTREEMEAGIGADFSEVKVHADPKSFSLNQALNAQAFTHGQDVFFNKGKYQPGSIEGQKLLAHELTHVVQQNGSTPGIQRVADLSQAPSDLACNLAVGSGIPNGTNVMFNVGSFVITTASKADIKNFASAWKASGSRDDVHVSGFASTDGPEALNWRLSCNRAAVVRQALMGEGIPAQNIDLWAHGETDVFSKTSLQSNRRAIITSFAPIPGTIAAPVAGAKMPPNPRSNNGKWTFSQTNVDNVGGAGYSSEANINFFPDPGVVNCDEIAFVQNVRVLENNAKPVLFPNEVPRVTATGWNIDRLDQRKHGWYGYNNDGKASGKIDAAGVKTGTVFPGSSPVPLKEAFMTDTPSHNVAPAMWDFETCAICKSGAQVNTVYGCLNWGFDVDAGGKLTSHLARTFQKPSGEFGEAVKKWNAQAAGPKAQLNDPDQQVLGPFN